MTILSDELANDPLTLGYSGMSDEAAATSLNDPIYSASGDIAELRLYMLRQTSRSNDGDDTLVSPIYGRLAEVARRNPGDQPFGTTDPQYVLTPREVHSAIALLALANGDERANFSTDTYFGDLLDRAVQSEIMQPADRTAIKALSDNLRSRAAVLDLKRVTVGDVTRARA